MMKRMTTLLAAVALLPALAACGGDALGRGAGRAGGGADGLAGGAGSLILA